MTHPAKARAAGTVEQAFADLLAAEPSRPFVTYYDESSGERTELSVRSLGNWVAKTHHLLQTELGLGAGDAAWLALPLHWVSVPILLGCACAGVQLTTDPARAAVAFGAPDELSAVDVPDRFAIAAERAAAGFAASSAPPGTLDYVFAVRPQADTWASVTFGAEPDQRWDDEFTRAELFAAAGARAADLGLGPGARLLSTRSWSGRDDWMDALLAPLAVQGSVVYVANAVEPLVVERRATQERATARLR